MSDYPMLISNKLHSFRNFAVQSYEIFLRLSGLNFSVRIDMVLFTKLYKGLF